MVLLSRFAWFGWRAISNSQTCTGCLLDLGTARQFMAAHGRWANRPKIAALITQCVFQQERLVIQHLLLDLLEAQWLWLRQRGIARAFAPDLPLQLSYSVVSALISLEGGRFFLTRFAADARLAFRLGIEQLL